MTWAQRLKRVFSIDIEVCGRCSGSVRVIACIEDQDVINSQKMVQRMAKDSATSKLTPEIVSMKIYEVITAAREPLRVPMDRAKALSVIKRFAPQAMIDKMISGLVNAAT